jgi:hypothetical protein
MLSCGHGVFLLHVHDPVLSSPFRHSFFLPSPFPAGLLLPGLPKIATIPLGNLLHGGNMPSQISIAEALDKLKKSAADFREHEEEIMASPEWAELKKEFTERAKAQNRSTPINPVVEAIHELSRSFVWANRRSDIIAVVAVLLSFLSFICSLWR